MLEGHHIGNLFIYLSVVYSDCREIWRGMQNDTQATGYITSVANYLKLRKLKIADGHHFENGNVIRYTCISAAVKKERKKERKKKQQM